jgi:aminoglycoside phosphotransferase (APT) family kinase protein
MGGMRESQAVSADQPATEEDFLLARARASGISPEIAVAAIDELLGASPTLVTQFAGGWGSVPFWATAHDGTGLVVRIAVEKRDYAREAAVIDRVRGAGIPGPEVIGVTTVDGHEVSVLRRVPGTAVQTLFRERGSDDPEVLDLCRQAGDWLAQIHDIDPQGLGLPTIWTHDRALEVIDSVIERVTGDHRSVLDAAREVVEPLRQPVELVLAHCDYGGDHILGNDGEVTAILDWERAELADPARDVAWWQLYEPDIGGGAAALREGYGPRSPEFDERVRAWVIKECLGAVNFLLDEGHETGAFGMLQRLEDLVRRM